MISKDLVAASATPIVLSILDQGESYGYAIIQQVHTLSGGEMQWSDGMLYPVLHRLERQKVLRSRWGVSETGRKRKYYRLTKKGKKVLQQSHKEWDVVRATLSRLWRENALCSREMMLSNNGAVL